MKSWTVFMKSVSHNKSLVQFLISQPVLNKNQKKLLNKSKKVIEILKWLSKGLT